MERSKFFRHPLVTLVDIRHTHDGHLISWTTILHSSFPKFRPQIRIQMPLYVLWSSNHCYKWSLTDHLLHLLSSQLKKFQVFSLANDTHPSPGQLWTKSLKYAFSDGLFSLPKAKLRSRKRSYRIKWPNLCLCLRSPWRLLWLQASRPIECSLFI